MSTTPRLSFFAVSCFVVFATSVSVAGASRHSDQLAERVAEITCRLAGLSMPDECGLLSFERVDLSGNVAEYRFQLRVGVGEYDRIGLHRVVREPDSEHAAPSGDVLMMLHGDFWPFDGAFMSQLGTSSTNGEPLPMFLAQNGVDVWGMDTRWTLVPLEASDPDTIMTDWDLLTDSADLGVALLFARVGRVLTGGGDEKLTLLGWSRGAQTGYAYVGEESQLPSTARHVKGFIPVDIWLKTDDETLRQSQCDIVPIIRGFIDQGLFADPGGSIRALGGELALEAPDDPSPIVPGLTNAELILFDGALPVVFFSPWYHQLGGVFDDLGLPIDFAFTDLQHAFKFYSGAAPYEPTRNSLQGAIANCDEEDSPLDDHLGDITVPVLYVGANGGAGQFGVYNTTLLGSIDVESIVVSLTKENESDFGHVDLFSSQQAREAAWIPILDWIKAH